MLPTSRRTQTRPLARKDIARLSEFRAGRGYGVRVSGSVSKAPPSTARLGQPGQRSSSVA